MTKDQAKTVRLPVQTALPAGWYALTWEVLAVDGHTTKGMLRFRIAE